MQFTFPFTINVYTSFSSIKKTSKEIHRNMIGQLQNDHSTDTLCVFLTPDIEQNNLIRINAFKPIEHFVKFNKNNLFANTHIMEGNKTQLHNTPKETLLNQESCICDHEETRQFSPPKRYQNLSMILQKFK